MSNNQEIINLISSEIFEYKDKFPDGVFKSIYDNLMKVYNDKRDDDEILKHQAENIFLHNHNEILKQLLAEKQKQINNYELQLKFNMCIINEYKKNICDFDYLYNTDNSLLYSKIISKIQKNEIKKGDYVFILFNDKVRKNKIPIEHRDNYELTFKFFTLLRIADPIVKVIVCDIGFIFGDNLEYYNHKAEYYQFPKPNRIFGATLYLCDLHKHLEYFYN